MIKNISTLKIQKLTKDQFQNGLENNILDDTSIYLTPVEVKDYALKSDLNTKADLIDNKVPKEQIPDIYLPKEMSGSPNGVATLDAKGKVPTKQIPEDIVNLSNYYTKTEVDKEIDSTKESFNAELTFKADLIDGKIPASQLPDDIGGEVTWEDIKNKPFGKTGWEYTWDGNTEGLEVISVAGGFLNFYKVSSDFIERSEIIGASYEMYFDSKNNTGVIDEAFISDGTNGSYVVLFNGSTPVILVTVGAGTETVMGMEVEIPSVGVWLPYFSEEEYPSYVGKGEIKKIDKEFLPDDIGGGVSSWNDLTDKPFGYESILLEMPKDISSLTKINSQNLEALGGISFSFVKLADALNEPQQILGASIEVYANNQTLNFVINEQNIYNTDNGFYYLSTDGGFYPLFINVKSEGTITLSSADMIGEDLLFENATPGLYFLCIEGIGSVISYENTILKQIDPKYIPNYYYEIGKGVVWDLNPTDTFLPLEPNGNEGYYKVSDSIFTKEDLIGMSLKAEMDGNSIDIILSADDIDDFGEYCYGLKDAPLFLITTQATEINMFGASFDFPSAGVWFIKGELTWTYQLGSFEIKQIDKKFIPSEIGAWKNMPDKPFFEQGAKIEWDGTPTNIYKTFQVDENQVGYFYKVAEPIDTLLNGQLSVALLDGNANLIISQDILTTTPEGEFLNEFIVNVKTANSTFNISDQLFITFDEVGVYFLSLTNEEGKTARVISFISDNYNIVKLDQKFLPDDIKVDLSEYYTKTETDNLFSSVEVDLSEYYTKTETDNIAAALENKVASAFYYKGTVNNYTDLPSENNTIGDVWNIVNADEGNEVSAGDNVAWNGTEWDILAGIVDLSGYYTKDEINNLIGGLDSMLDSINLFIEGEVEQI